MDHSLEWFSTNKHVSRKTDVCVEGLHSKRKCTENNKNLNTLLKTMFPIQKSHHAEITKNSPSFSFHTKKHHHKGAGDPLRSKYPIHGPPQTLRRQVR
jgi:hypothetical protein